MAVAKLPFKEVVPVYSPLNNVWSAYFPTSCAGWLGEKWHIAEFYFAFILSQVRLNIFIYLKVIFISFAMDYFYVFCPYIFYWIGLFPH